MQVPTATVRVPAILNPSRSDLEQHADAKEYLDKIETKYCDSEGEVWSPVRRIGPFDLPRNREGRKKAKHDCTSSGEMKWVLEDISCVEKNEGKSDQKANPAQHGQYWPRLAMPLDSSERKRGVFFSCEPDGDAEPTVIEKQQCHERVIAGMDQPKIGKKLSVYQRIVHEQNHLSSFCRHAFFIVVLGVSSTSFTALPRLCPPCPSPYGF